MQKIVVDTNVVVSATKSPSGKPAKILDMIFDMEVQMYYSVEILEEYIEVLSRPKLNISTSVQTNIINAIQHFGILVEPSISESPIPDEDDRIFYDAAMTTGSYLITGNLKHYPNESLILSSADFLKLFS